MGIIFIAIVFAVIFHLLQRNSFVLKNDLEEVLGLGKWLSVLVMTISSIILFLQLSTRESDLTRYKEKRDIITSYAQSSETISIEEKKALIDDIRYYNSGIINSEKYGDNIFIGMFHNPLILELETIDYKLITEIPLHQNTYVNVGDEVIED